MSRRPLSLALLSLCAPVAFAHPPCPREPVDIDPVLSRPEATAVPHLSVSTSFVGDSAVLTALQRHSKDIISTGNCRTGDSHIELPGPSSAGPALGIQPPYATRAGFGMLGLPDLRSAPLDTSLTYRLDFKIAQRPLPADGDWVDVLQFEFRWNGWPDAGKNLPSTLYRLRLRQSTDRGVPVVAEFIEVRRADPDSGHSTEQVVASLPLNAPDNKIPVALQWHQRNRLPGDGDIINPPIDDPQVMGVPQAGTEDIGIIGIGVGEASASIVNPVDSTFQILGPDGVVLYSASLPEQWAESLQLGLLNYHSPSIPGAVLTPGAYLSEETLSVKMEE